MADKVYECFFIFNANAYARNPGNAGDAIKKIADSVGGELRASRMWNEQKLAYPIKGQRKGVYWLSYVSMDGDVVPKFNRACRLTDIILRHLVISIDPRLVDTLVDAASQTASSETAGTSEKESESDRKKTDDSTASSSSKKSPPKESEASSEQESESREKESVTAE